MTREEQILNNALNYSEIEDNFMGYYDCGDVCDDKDFIEKACIESAKWADKTMIDKACDLLARMVYEVTYKSLEGDSSVEHYDKMEFIEEFKKAMKE